MKSLFKCLLFISLVIIIPYEGKCEPVDQKPPETENPQPSDEFFLLGLGPTFGVATMFSGHSLDGGMSSWIGIRDFPAILGLDLSAKKFKDSHVGSLYSVLFGFSVILRNKPDKKHLEGNSFVDMVERFLTFISLSFRQGMVTHFKKKLKKEWDPLKARFVRKEKDIYNTFCTEFSLGVGGHFVEGCTVSLECGGLFVPAHGVSRFCFGLRVGLGNFSYQ